MAGGLLPLR